MPGNGEGGSAQNPVVVKLEEGGGGCGIPDYQKEITQLKEALAHKTRMCDRIEGQKGRMTMEINRLKSDLSQGFAENESHRREKMVYVNKIQDLQERVELCQGIALLKQVQEEAQHTAEILSSMLAKERATKRQRREGDDQHHHGAA